MTTKPLLLFVLLGLAMMENDVLGQQTDEDYIFSFIKKVEELLDKDDYNGILKVYEDHQKIEPYYKQQRTCETLGRWNLYDSCALHYFHPTETIVDFLKIGGKDREKWERASDRWSLHWSLPNGSWSYTWKDMNITRPVFSGMINLLKKTLKKDSALMDLFTREMFFARLNQLMPAAFPMKESPLGQDAQKWSEYAKEANDKEVRKLFGLNITSRVLAHCKAQEQRTLLCSFLAAKNKYMDAMRSLPQNNKSNVTSIWAYVGDENGQYTSFKQELDRFLDIGKITGSIEELRKRLSGYFQTLARFDNGIAQADVGYLKTAIDKNNQRLGDSVKKLTASVESIKRDKGECDRLNLIESIFNLIVNLAGCVMGGAGALSTISSLGDTAKGVTKAFVKVSAVLDVGGKAAVEIGTKLAGIQTTQANVEEMKKKMGDTKDSIDAILKAMDKNKENIDGMNDIMASVIGGGPLSSVQNQVDKFLTSYSDYTPGVTKDDLGKLNTMYEQMLDSYAESFKEAGTWCRAAMPGAGARVREAKAIWSSINTLLADVYDQQFDLITALVKVVRSKLDETAAKTIDPDIKYDFEITIRNMLAVRVAAQEVCNVYQYLNNDVQDSVCYSIRDTMLLPDSIRTRIKEKDEHLRRLLVSYPANKYTAFIPLSTANAPSSPHAINWNQLMSGDIIEFALPTDNKTFLLENRWIRFLDQAIKEPLLLKSLEVFIPNILPNSKDSGAVQFDISAIQGSIVVNSKHKAQRYTIRSDYPISTKSTYDVNDVACQGTVLDEKLVNGSKYCIPSDSGRFGDNLKIALPVSMYSKFQIRLANVYPANALDHLQKGPPAGTMKLPVNIQVYSNSGRRQCPTGLVPNADGGYCISEVAEPGVTTTPPPAKPVAAASDKESVEVEQFTIDTKPVQVPYERVHTWKRLEKGKTESEPYTVDTKPVSVFDRLHNDAKNRLEKNPPRSSGHDLGKNIHWKPFRSTGGK